MHYIQFQFPLTTMWARRLLLPSWLMGRKRGSAWIASCLGTCCSPNFWTIQSFSLLSTVFSECEHPFIDKLMVITEPVELSTRLLGLGSTLYPWPAMCSACLTQIFLDSCRIFLSMPKSSKQKKAGSAGRVPVNKPYSHSDYLLK